MKSILPDELIESVITLTSNHCRVLFCHRGTGVERVCGRAGKCRRTQPEAHEGISEAGRAPPRPYFALAPTSIGWSPGWTPQSPVTDEALESIRAARATNWRRTHAKLLSTSRSVKTSFSPYKAAPAQEDGVSTNSKPSPYRTRGSNQRSKGR